MSKGGAAIGTAGQIGQETGGKRSGKITKAAPEGGLWEFGKARRTQALTESFNALAMANFTCLSAPLVTVSPVAGLRT